MARSDKEMMISDMEGLDDIRVRVEKDQVFSVGWVYETSPVWFDADGARLIIKFLEAHLPDPPNNGEQG